MAAADTAGDLRRRIDEAQRRREAAFLMHVAPLDEEIRALRAARASRSSAEGPAAVPPRASLLMAAAGLALAVVLWGGYSHHWPWTGIDGATATLWDWLHLLLLPVVFALLPVWVSRETHMGSQAKRLALVIVLLFGVIVVSGYAVPWGWTGFTGNTLWDWLNLVVLPVTLLLMPGFAEMRAAWRARHTFMAALLLVAFGALVLGGYVGDWTWTGFTGNTLWNWLNLLLLPLLLPTVVVPALMPVALGHVSGGEDGVNAVGQADGESRSSPGR